MTNLPKTSEWEENRMGSMIEISVITLLPSLMLCYFVYKKDKVEKEPLLLLLLLFFVGAAVALPTVWCERALTGQFDNLYASYMEITESGRLNFSSESAMVTHHLLCAFAGVALLEEGVRWLALVLITRKNKNFDCLYDGIVYSVFISMGYAMVINLRYALVDGWNHLFMRAISTVPAYLLWGILSGVLYTIWHSLNIAREKEKALVDSGTYDKVLLKNPGWLLVASFVLPFVFHGISAFVELFNSRVLTSVFCVLLMLAYIICFVLVFKMSDKDEKNTLLSDRIIRRKHPQEIGE